MKKIAIPRKEAENSAIAENPGIGAKVEN